jgi:DNA repair protein RadC
VYEAAHLELVRDLHVRPILAPVSPDDAARVFREWGLTRSAQERFWVMAYDYNLTLNQVIEVAVGGWGKVEVPVHAVVAAVLTARCDRFVVVHNHPTNDVRPSQQDLDLTQAIYEAAVVCELSLEDHIIVGPGLAYLSMVEQGLYRPRPMVPTDTEERVSVVIPTPPPLPEGSASVAADQGLRCEVHGKTFATPGGYAWHMANIKH